MSECVPCEKCGCEGNLTCLYPPTADEIEKTGMDCSLDHNLECWCCRNGIDRMAYRPEEDGQLTLLGVG